MNKPFHIKDGCVFIHLSHRMGFSAEPVQNPALYNESYNDRDSGDNRCFNPLSTEIFSSKKTLHFQKAPSNYNEVIMHKKRR